MAYNPYAYVPGGSSPLVSQATQEAGYGMGAPAFDLEALLRNNPMLLGQFRQLGWDWNGPTGAGQLQQSLLPTQEAYNQALINYGAIPEGMNVADSVRGSALDATRGGLSQLAQAAHAYQLANSQSTGAVGARGLGRSGAIGQHLMENLHGLNVNNATLQANLMNTLGGIRQQQAGLASTAMGQAQTATNDAMQRIVAQIQNSTIASPTNLTHAKLPLPAAPTPYVPRTNPGSFTPSTQGQVASGTAGNRFQYVPGRGRAPLGSYASPTNASPQYGGRALR